MMRYPTWPLSLYNEKQMRVDPLPYGWIGSITVNHIMGMETYME
jgi:hypothetical protein